MALVAHWDWVIYNFRLPLARALREAGAHVVLVCPSGKYVSHFLQEGFRWHRWDVSRRGIHPWRELSAIRQLTNFYKKERFVLVQHFTVKPNLYGTLAARLANLPVVVNLFSGLGFVFTPTIKARLIRILIRPLLRNLLQRKGTISVFQNPTDQLRFVQMKLAPFEATRVIKGTGVDVTRFAPPSGKATSPPMVLMACRLIKEKGVEEFVNAARRVAAAGIEARWVVAGEPDEGNPSAIARDQLRRWQREDIIQWIGHVDDVLPLLQEASIAVLPTYYPEGIPKFLLEAAAVGLPMVATNIPPCREVVEHGRNGFLVPPLDAYSLARSIEVLLRDEEMRTLFGVSSREIAVSRFDQKKIVSAYMDLYRSLGVQLHQD